MAVVRITKELIDSVERAARKLYESAVDTATDAQPDIGGEVYDLIMEEYKTRIALLPECFFCKTKDITIRANLPGLSLMAERWKMSEERMVPEALPETADFSAAYSSYSGLIVSINSGKKFDHIIEQLVVWKTSVHNAEEAVRKTGHNVREVLAAYKTLAPALKAWPALWELLPEYYKDKHREIVERRVPAVIPEDSIDCLENLTAKLAANRIMEQK